MIDLQKRRLGRAMLHHAGRAPVIPQPSGDATAACVAERIAAE